MTKTINGFTFPFQINPATGGVSKSTGSDKLRENLKQIILTGVGERVMCREYGGGVSQLVNDPNNTALSAIVQHQITKNITRWEPRVLLQEVAITQDRRDLGKLWVEIRYLDRQSQTEENLSFQLGLGGI